MMYSEFIEITGNSESYISYVEYSTFIEPIYMDCKLPNKYEFCKMFNELLEKLVYPAVEKVLDSLSLEQACEYVFNDSKEVAEIIKEKDFAARKVMYKYLELMANI